MLGLNRNFGERIYLRLRTDAYDGFRSYDSIMNTLIHELTHNVFGPHDQKFWNLFAEMKKQYMQFHEKYNKFVSTLLFKNGERYRFLFCHKIS